MSHEKLINLLNQYGTISEIEKLNIEKYFISAKIKKKQVLIEKYLPCNKLFFINNGLLRAYYINDKGKEITRMKLFACAAWKQDKAAWNNLINVRSSAKTQTETKLIAENIKKLIYK